MSSSHHRRFVVISTELAAIVGASLATLSVGAPPPAMASASQPVVAHVVDAPPGITFDSPWVTDSTGSVAWALGVNAAGVGVLARRDLASTAITTSATVTGEVGASDASLSPTTGTIAFLAKRSAGGDRIVVIDPTTRARVTSYDTTASARGIRFNPTGTALYTGVNGATPTVIKVSASTGVLVSSVAQAVGPVTSGAMLGTRFIATLGTTSPRLVAFKDNTSISVDTSTTLTGLTEELVDPVVVGNVGWYGTLGNPGRLIGIDLSLRKIVANYPLNAGEVALRRLALSLDSGVVYGTTESNGETILVALRLSDGQRLSSTPVGPYLGATSVSLSGHYVDVTFPSSVALVRVTTASPPTTPAVTAVDERDGKLSVAWDASESQEPVVTYTVTAESATQSASCTTVLTSCAITGLTNGAEYQVTVRATSFAGSSGTSGAVTASPATVPDSVQNIEVNRTDTAATVSWIPGGDGGRPIRDYTVHLEPGGYSCTTPTRSCMFITLSPETVYTARVVARSAHGESSAVSATVPVVVIPPVVEPPALPDPPIPRRITLPETPTRVTLTTVTRMSYTLSWSAPANGGSPLIDYRIATRVSGSERFATVSDAVSPRTSVVIRRPSVDKAIYVEVTAVNALGPSRIPATVLIRGSRLYPIRNVAAVRFSDAAAFFGSLARSTRYDGTRVLSVDAHSSRL